MKMFGAMKVLILVLGTFTAALENHVEPEPYLNSRDGRICNTPGCVEAAAQILKSLDQSVDPCDDFFQFACGGFINSTIIPSDKPSISQFSILRDRIVDQLRVIFEEPPQPNEIRPFALLKNYYKMCMNTSKIERTELGYMKSILSELGGWPVLDPTWNEAGWDWKNLTYSLRKKGFSTTHLMKVYADKDVLNTSQMVINIDQASLGIDREYLVLGFEDKVVQAYYNFLVDVAVTFGAKNEQAEKDMKDVLEFEMKLAEITLPKEERRNVSALTNPMNVSTLTATFSIVDWPYYLHEIVNLDAITICPSDMVDVGVPKYLDNLKYLLEKTPKRVLANYLLNQAIVDSVDYLTPELLKQKQKLKESQTGSQEMSPRWRQCTIWTATNLDLAADGIYARRYSSDEAKRSAEELVTNLKSTFSNMLTQSDWMDEATKKTALEKAAAMVTYIAYPQELRDDHKLEEYYSQLESNPESFLQFGLNIDKFETDRSFAKLPKPVNKTDWVDHSFVADVDAYYNLLENSIQLSAGILQGVFFNKDRPNYINYGAIGFGIGHEITHGFDDQGRQFDKDGNVKNWWAQKTNDAFEEKAQCIIDQYGNITVPEVGLNLNGINTQGENIADNGGVKEAYLAYNYWAKRHGEEPRLPGLAYSQWQLFWISTASLWCAKDRPESLRQQILTDPHAPTKYRVNVPLSNSPQFARDFNCPAGSRMNPEHKCQVWLPSGSTYLTPNLKLSLCFVILLTIYCRMS